MNTVSFEFSGNSTLVHSQMAGNECLTVSCIFQCFNLIPLLLAEMREFWSHKQHKVFDFRPQMGGGTPSHLKSSCCIWQWNLGKLVNYFEIHCCPVNL